MYLLALFWVPTMSDVHPPPLPDPLSQPADWTPPPCLYEVPCPADSLLPLQTLSFLCCLKTASWGVVLQTFAVGLGSFVEQFTPAPSQQCHVDTDFHSFQSGMFDFQPLTVLFLFTSGVFPHQMERVAWRRWTCRSIKVCEMCWLEPFHARGSWIFVVLVVLF